MVTAITTITIMIMIIAEPVRIAGKLLVAAALFAACAGVAHADVYPSRPITIVVPYPAGGVTDNLVRLLAERMKTSLGQPIVTENMGGASGTIGAARVARAEPGGVCADARHHVIVLQSVDGLRASGAVAELSVLAGEHQ
jgi:tripartite-type tricarboxylate transporter receptor subunit TctC